MKWDKENKEKLRNALELRFGLIDPFDRADFLREYSIELVRQNCGRGQSWGFCDENGKWSGCGKAHNKDRIIIVFDPLMLGGTYGLTTYGLSIPKDVAEKFLILGVP